jgi:hypothetical protein
VEEVMARRRRGLAGTPAVHGRNAEAHLDQAYAAFNKGLSESTCGRRLERLMQASQLLGAARANAIDADHVDTGWEKAATTLGKRIAGAVKFCARG